MKGLSEEVREIMKEYIGDNSVAGVAVLAVQDGKEICDCQEGMAVSYTHLTLPTNSLV